MPTLVYCDGDGASATCMLQGTVLIGRSPECAIRSADPRVENRHARFFEIGGEYFVEDLGSRSGVFVEAAGRVRQSRIHVGDVVVVGSLVIRIDDGEDGAHAPLLAAVELARLLGVAQKRQLELEEERNALGRRVGELHSELEAARRARSDSMALEPTRAPGVPPQAVRRPKGDSMALEPTRAPGLPIEPTHVTGYADDTDDGDGTDGGEDTDGGATIAAQPRSRAGADTAPAPTPSDLAELAEQVREAEKKVVRAQGRLDKLESNLDAIREKISAKVKEADGASPGQTEVIQVQLLSLNAQLAETERARERQADKLAAARVELDDCRVQARKTVKIPRQERPDPEGNTAQRKISDLRRRFDTEFARAVTLQRKLKNAEQRAEKLEAELEAATAARQELEGRIAELESGGEKKSQVAALENMLAATRRGATEAGRRARELESRLAERDAALEEREAELSSLRSQLDEARGAAEAAAESSRSGELEEAMADLRGELDEATRSRDAALAARRELEGKRIAAEAAARESAAKLENAGRRATEARARRERAEARAAELERALESSRAELAALREELAAEPEPDGEARDDSRVIRLEKQLRDSQQEMDAELDRLSRRVRELETDLDRALDAEQVALARADADQAAHKEKIDELSRQLGSTRDELSLTSDQLASIRHELSESQEREEALASDLKEAIAAADDAAMQLEEARQEAAAAEARVADLEGENRELKDARGRAERLEGELETTRSQLASARGELTKIREELEAAREDEGQVSDLRARVVELASQNAKMSAELAGLRGDKEELERRRKNDRAELSRLESALAATHKRLEELELDLDDLTGPPTENADRPDTEEVTASGVKRRYDTVSDTEEHTEVAAPQPALIEWMLQLQGAITDLRKQMRAAADEAAMLGSGESVEVINGALSAAVERVETAREAIENITELFDLRE